MCCEDMILKIKKYILQIILVSKIVFSSSKVRVALKGVTDHILLAERVAVWAKLSGINSTTESTIT